MWADLPIKDKAVVIALIDKRVKEEKEEQKRAERRAKSKGHR